jgi:carbon-monoxide dehydrogenase catalytic subunit
LVQDAIFGTASPHIVDVDLGIIDPEYVNIMVNGHEPFVGAALIQIARQTEHQERAKAAGAKGLRIIGSIETGQELVQRFKTDNVFVGLTGNWLSIEPALATGGIDVLAMDMNCSPPTLGEYQDKYNTTIVSVSKLVNIPGMATQIIYKPEEVASQAEKLIDIAIENFNKRKGKVTHPSDQKQKALIGFSTEACLTALGGKLDPLLDVIKNGSIKGVVALVSCTTLTNRGQDINSIAIAKELIKRDILVLSAGCGNAAMQVGGLTTLEARNKAGPGLKAVCEKLNIPPVLSFGTCTDTGRIALLVAAVADALGVDTSQLPVAVTAPTYMEQKATIDGIFAVAFGLYTHVSPVPYVAGAPRLVKLLTEDVEGLTGGKLAVETDMIMAANGIEDHINKKRKALGLHIK